LKSIPFTASSIFERTKVNIYYILPLQRSVLQQQRTRCLIGIVMDLTESIRMNYETIGVVFQAAYF
jgi:hypothetical protein